MEESTDSDTNVSEDQFETIVKQLKGRNKRSYDVLTKAGADFQDSVFKLCKRMIKEESFPTRFSKTTLYNLWKRKGSRNDLNNHRYIHLKDWLPRLVETITADMMKDDMFEGGTKY